MSSAAGRSFGPYEILGPLGSGGMGEVFRARDTRLDRIVAIKTSREQFSDRFAREARATAALNHPHIATLYDVGPDYLVMEFVEGETLRGPLPVGRALAYARQILEALDAAHRKGIVHRDLKPANIMIGKTGVKLLDFGLAQMNPMGPLGESAATVALSAEGTIAGTLQYMSPEQLQGKPADTRSDLFSFGLVLYEMLTGRRAFDGDSAASVISAIMTSEPPPLHGLQPLALPALERLLQQCLAKDPDERWQSAADVRRALDLIDTTPPPQTVPRRSRWPWAAAALAAIVLGVAGYRLAPRSAPAEWTFRPLTYSGRAYKPSLSPDGKQVAFIWGGEKDENFSLYVQLVGGGNPLRLDNARPAGRAEWSADGGRLAFLRGDGLYVMPALGGPARRIAAFEPSQGDMAWSAAGFFVVPRGGALHTVSADGGDTRPVTKPGAAFDHSPAVSPDSSAVAFVRHTSTYNSAVFVLPVNRDGAASGGEKQFTAGIWDVGVVQWSRDGREIVFEGSAGSSNSSIWRIPRQGGTAVRFPAPSAVSGQPAIALQADRMVYVSGQLETAIVKLPLGGAGAPQPIVESMGDQRDLGVSPDGSRIAFTSNRTGSKEIWIANADGSNQTQLTFFNGPSNGSPRFSPDGKRIAFDGYASGSSDIYLVSVDGGKPERLTHDSGNEVRPSWSHDGQWIYFGWSGGRETQVWRIRPSGGDPVQVTRHGGNQAFESPDGQWLFVDLPPKMMRMRTDGSEEKVLREDVRSNFWNLGNRHVYVLDPKQHALVRMPFAGEAFQAVHQFHGKDEPQGGGMAFAVPWDESFAIYRRETRAPANLMLIEGFR